jgi:hypothetical protein
MKEKFPGQLCSKAARMGKRGRIVVAEFRTSRMCVRSGRGTPTSTESKSGLNPHTTAAVVVSYLISSLASHSFHARFHSLISLYVRLVHVAFWVGPFDRHVRPSAKKFTCSLVATVEPDGRRGIKWKTGGCNRPLGLAKREGRRR